MQNTEYKIATTERMYGSVEEVIGKLYLSGVLGSIKKGNVLLLATVMFNQGITIDNAIERFPEQFKAGEE